jgi:hypothetical protein
MSMGNLLSRDSSPSAFPWGEKFLIPVLMNARRGDFSPVPVPMWEIYSRKEVAPVINATFREQKQIHDVKSIYLNKQDFILQETFTWV